MLQRTPKQRPEQERQAKYRNFIKRSLQQHPSGYLYIGTFDAFVNMKTKVPILCIKHGFFWQSPEKHVVKGQGCPTCGREKCRAKPLPLEKWFKKAKKLRQLKLHIWDYDYSRVHETYVNSRSLVCIGCPKHGWFWQRAYSHIKNGKRPPHGCPKCKRSIGEDRIAAWLNEHGIEYVEQWSHDECRKAGGWRKRFDFYLPKSNQLIEFDGSQHFIAVPGWGGDQQLEKVQESDRMKSEFAKQKDIDLLRIRYDQFNQTEELLENFVPK